MATDPFAALGFQPHAAKPVAGDSADPFSSLGFQASNGPTPTDLNSFRFPAPKEDKMVAIKSDIAQKNAEAKKASSPLGFLGNFGKAVVENVASSEVNLGKTIGGIGNTLGGNVDSMSKSLDSLTKTQADTLKKIREKKANGIDTSADEKFYNSISDQVDELNKTLGTTTAPTQKTNTQVLGELGGTAVDLLASGTYGKAAKEASTGKLLKARPSILPSTEQKFLSKETGKEIIAGGAGGYAFDVTQNMQEGKTGMGIAKPGLGTALGLTIPIAGRGEPAFRNVMEKRQAENIIKESKKIDTLAGTIVQGKASDIEKAKKALSDIDVKGIKTYDDLKSTLDTKINTLSGKLDETLATKGDTKTLSNLNLDSKVGGETVSHNFVNDALTQLEDHYVKINDPVGKAQIEQLKLKAQNEGLTVKEINDLAKTHGKEINAFNANGEAASGLTKQAAENTRMGLKSTAREIFGDPVYKVADKEISNLIRVRDLVSKVSEEVTKLQQKVTARGPLEKIGKRAFEVIDLLSGKAFSGFLRSALVPRGGGLKIMNALDLENMLQKNLKKLQRVNTSTSESEVIKILDEIIQSSPSSQSPKLGNIQVKSPTSPKNIHQQTKMVNNVATPTTIQPKDGKASLGSLGVKKNLNNGSTKPETLVTGAVALGTLTALATPSKPITYTKSPEKVDTTLREAIAHNETRGETDPYSFSQPSGDKRYGKALGRYQITEAELKTYANRFLGKSLTSAAFLASPGIQDEYMQNKINYLKSKGLTPEQIFAAHRGGFSDFGKADEKVKKYKSYVENGIKKLKELQRN